MLRKTLAATLILTAGTTNWSFAQDPITQQTASTRSQNLERLDSKTEGMSVRASKLIGMNIQNSRNENVGQVKDLVINPVTTRVQYVAVTYGGFLGMGDKMFAVPMHAIKVAADSGRKGQLVLVLDVTKEQLEGAQGFDQENWPDFSDEKFHEEIHRRYGVLDRWTNERNRDGKVEIRVDRSGVQLGVDGSRK